MLKDARVVTATNRTLIDEVGDGSFREDLFYRLAVAVIILPPLRNRTEDISLLTEHFLKQINKDSKNVPGYEHKAITVEAINFLRSHPWPGNVSKLQNTPTRAMLWTDRKIIDAEVISKALLPLPASVRKKDNIMERPLGNGFDIKTLEEEVRGHYYRRALAETHNNKSLAAKLLGLQNYQTLTSWLKKHNSLSIQQINIIPVNVINRLP